MVLVDTSVWVDHLRRGDPRLQQLLYDERVTCHPFVIGELALGRLRRGSETLELLAELPSSATADHAEVMHFVALHALGGAGIGWVDAHLLCAAALGRTSLWSRDTRLAAAAARLGIGWGG